MAVKTTESRSTRGRFSRYKQQYVVRTARVQKQLETWGISKAIGKITPWLEKVYRKGAIPEKAFPDTKEIWLLLFKYSLASGISESHRLLQELSPQPKTFADFGFSGDIEKALDSFVDSKPPELWHHVVPQEGLRWMQNYVYEIQSTLEFSLMERIKKVIHQGIGDIGYTGDPEDVVKERLRSILPGFSNARIQAIARTETMRCYNMGHLIEMKRLPGYVQGVEFSSVLDSRTTEMCERRNRLFLKMDDPRLIQNTPPLHPNCRSVLIPVMKVEGTRESKWEKDGQKLDRLHYSDPPMTRSSDREIVQEILSGGWTEEKANTAPFS